MPTSRLIFTLKHHCKSGTQIHQVHAQAITSGLFSLYPSPLLSHILHSFISSSPQRNTTAPPMYDIVYCTNIFNLIPNPSNFNYNDIIKAHTVLHSPRTALILFLEMRQRLIAPNYYTFILVLKACGLLQNSHYQQKPQMPTSPLIFTLKRLCRSGTQIHQVHAQAITSGLFSLYPSPFLSRILHSFISSFPQRNNTAPSKYDIVYCTNIFNLIPNPSNFNYNDIIKAHTVLHSPRTALILFLEMRRRLIAPNYYTFIFVLKACGLLQNSHYLAKALHAQLTKFEFSDNMYVRSTLCWTYGKSGDIDGADRVFKGSSFRNVVSYDTMINIFLKAGEFNCARALFNEMSISLRNAVSYNAMIDGLFKGGDINGAKELFDEMPIYFRDVVSYNTMIDGLFNGGDIDRAKELFDEMPISFRDVVSYNSMIDGLIKAGDIGRARELFDEMPIELRNVRTYNIMIDGLSKGGDIDRARDLFNEMPISFKNVVSYTVMIDGLFKAGDIDRARELFNKMPISFRDALSYNVMLMGLAMHGQGGSVLEQYLSRMLKDDVKADGGLYWCLAHIYANLGQCGE